GLHPCWFESGQGHQFIGRGSREPLPQAFIADDIFSRQAAERLPRSRSPCSTDEHANSTSKMTTASYILLGSAALIILVAIVWRVASRGRSIPCPVWLRWLVELDNPFAKTNRAAVIVQHLDLQPGMAVVDVGCGPGRVTIPIAEQVGRQGE